MMRIISIAVACTALLAGCDQSDKTFGKTYDECLLKNAAQSEANEICARHFERLRTFEERDAEFLVTSSDLNILDTGTGKQIEFQITNRSTDKIARTYRVSLSFWPNDSVVPSEPFVRQIQAIQNDLPHADFNRSEPIQPGETITVNLPIPDSAIIRTPGLPDTLYGPIAVDAQIWMVTPMREK